MSNLNLRLAIIALFSIVANAYKITREAVPVPAIKNAALEYKGPVFLIKETTDANEPFIGLIVDGGIEMVRPNPKPSLVPYANLPTHTNESTPEIQEDPEYFAVLVTPETVAQAQISRSTTITIPLTALLSGIAARIPWLMVLRKQNHFEYFNTLILNPIKPIPMPPRRRYKREIFLEHGRLFSNDKKYDMLYTEKDKIKAHGICTTLVQEMISLNNMLHGNSGSSSDSSDSSNVSNSSSSSSSTHTPDEDTDVFDLRNNKNLTQVEKDTTEEYALATESTFSQNST